jgi:hypothetical protein
MSSLKIHLFAFGHTVLPLLILTALVSACGNGGRDDVRAWDPEKRAKPESYAEGDSFPSAGLPETIINWLAYYAPLDTGIRIHRMLSPGVPLHIGELQPSGREIMRGSMLLSPGIAYAPDSLRAIDIAGYGTVADTGKMGTITWQGGEADQEVALVMTREGKAWQLMFNGPQSTAEAAGWLSNDACLVGLIQRDEVRRRFYPELMLFHFRDSTFTNFRTVGDYPLERLQQLPGDFLEQRTQKINSPRHE